MISFILGILTSIIISRFLKPKKIVLYSQDIIDELDVRYEDMRQFSTNIDGIRYAWDIEKLWIEFESLDSIDWIIPSSFKDEWSWGRSHPSEHIERCLKADLSYPILVWDGAIIDGCHRTVMALANGERTIKAKVIVNIPPPDEETDLIKEESNEGVHWTYGDMVKIIKAVQGYEVTKDYEYRHPADGI